MTARSQNGYSANDRSVIASYQLPGGRVALRAGDVSVVLLWVANQFHQHVEPLVWPGVWGYAERTIRGSDTVLSNHASGTAIDLNAPRHPLGVRGTFTGNQVQAIRRILDYCEGAVRWGGDYTGRADEMHFEINAGSTAVRRIADKIRTPPPPPAPPPAVRRRLPEEEDVIYVKCESVKGGEIWTGILSGGVVIGPLSTGELVTAQRNIDERGAWVQWVERSTWDRLAAR